MRKTINKETISGRVYDLSQLALKKVENKESENYGKEYIGGTIDIATDDKCLNIISVPFTFVQPTFKSGKPNASYGVLKSLIENGATILNGGNNGKDPIPMVKVDASLALNDFYTQKNGQETLVSAKKNNGSFINKVTKLDNEDRRSTFEVDFLINEIVEVEADEERNIPDDYLILKGAAFAFNGAILPTDLIVKNPDGIKYFRSLNIDKKNPVFTKVWGQIKSQTITKTKADESAFGEPAVTEYTRTVREWVVTGTSKPDAIYPIGDEEAGITVEEVSQKLADRETYLAGVKQRADEYQASKNAGSTTATVANSSAAIGGFNF